MSDVAFWGSERRIEVVASAAGGTSRVGGATWRREVNAA